MDGLDEQCMSHIKATGMNLKKYKKIATFVDKIVQTKPGEDELLKQFANKCYASFDEKDGLRQAKKFLKVLFGNDLSTLVEKGSTAALKAASNSAPDVMRIVRLNKPQGGFTKKLDRYVIGETLGKGATSKVKLGKDEETGQEVALKILTDGSFNKEDLRKEIDILKKLDHPNVIRLFDSYDNVADAGSTAKTTTVIVLELATKGELFDFFMYTGFFEPPLARWFFKQMLAGIEYCHNNGVAHRDLKPENCLLGDGFVIKLVDFGFATVFKGESGMENKMLTALGTPGYAAPEILKRKKYTKNVDIFSLGVILFITIAGFPPFQEAKAEADWWFHKLMKKKYSLFWKAHERTAKFSPEAKELLIGMLAADPTERWTIEKIKNCAWYKGATFSQDDAVDALLTRKAKVEKEKINAGAVRDGPLMRGDATVRAPPVGTYRPPNAFYCAPGPHGAVDIRQIIEECIGQTVMGKTSKEYIETGDSTEPLCPEDVPADDWNPWWDISFKCELVEESGKDDMPPMKYQFEGAVYIREDGSYKPPKDNPEYRRHIVYFKRRKGLVHKWIKAMFKIQMKVGFFHVQPEEAPVVPKVSPIKMAAAGPTAEVAA